MTISIIDIKFYIVHCLFIVVLAEVKLHYRSGSRHYYTITIETNYLITMIAI